MQKAEWAEARKQHAHDQQLFYISLAQLATPYDSSRPQTTLEDKANEDRVLSTVQLAI